MNLCFKTADVAESKRFTFWQSTFSKTLGQFDCSRHSNETFSGEILSRSAGEVRFTNVKSRSHIARRTNTEIRQSERETVFFHVHVAGSAVIAQDGRDIRLIPGDIALFDGTRPCSLNFEEDFELLAVHLPREILTKTAGRTERFTARALNAESLVAPLLANHLTATAQMLPAASDGVAHELSGIAIELIGATLCSLGRRQRNETWSRTVLIYRAKAYAEEHLSDPRLRPQQVADTLGISARYLQTLFKAEGTTFSDWIWRRRLERGRHRLRETSLLEYNIGQIALECGFSDFSHFSRRFRQAYGESPNEFRMMYQRPKIQRQ